VKLSLITEIIKSSTNVVDNTDPYHWSVHRNYPAGCEMQFDGSIWQNVGETIIVPIYNSTVSYSLGDIVYKDGMVQKIIDFNDSQQPKQPEDYTAHDTSHDSSDWTERYIKLFDPFTDGDSYTIGDYTHVFSDWREAHGKIAHTITGSSGFGGVQYQARHFYEVNNDTTEMTPDVPAYGLDNADTGYGFWTFITRNDALYARTHVNVPTEYVTISGSDPVFAIVSHIDQLGTFARVRPTLDNAPFDDKHYSKAIRADSMTFTVNVLSAKFDTLALGRVTGTTADVYFYDGPDGTGTLIDSTVGYPIDTKRDVGGLLPEYQTTTIIYSDTVINPGGSIRFVIDGNNVKLGTIMAGLKVDAGFTNLVFSNSFIDHSPKNVDNWGNVEYIEGIKVNVFDGTVDIPITTYDMMTRLMESIGGSTVILNGSDSINNTAPDSESIFASTMLIGRMSNFRLQTKLDKKRIGDLATYSIKLTELT